jgi:hypothetical protein
MCCPSCCRGPDLGGHDWCLDCEDNPSCRTVRRAESEPIYWYRPSPDEQARLRGLRSPRDTPDSLASLRRGMGIPDEDSYVEDPDAVCESTAEGTLRACVDKYGGPDRDSNDKKKQPDASQGSSNSKNKISSAQAVVGNASSARREDTSEASASNSGVSKARSSTASKHGKHDQKQQNLSPRAKDNADHGAQGKQKCVAM